MTCRRHVSEAPAANSPCTHLVADIGEFDLIIGLGACVVAAERRMV